MKDNEITILMYFILFIFFVGMVFLYYISKDSSPKITKKVKKQLGVLTGKYSHIKTPNGNKVLVQVLEEGETSPKFRESTKKEIDILTKLKFLK